MPTLGYRKDLGSRTYPVSFSLPGYIMEALDKELEATGESGRSKLLVKIINFWLDHKDDDRPSDLIEEDLDRFRSFVR